MKRSLLLLWLAFPAGALASTDAAALEAQIRAADTAFCAFAATHGVAAAFAEFAAPDATLLGTDPEHLRGQAAVAREFGHVPPGLKLTWKPLFASVAASGDLGYTWGSYLIVDAHADGTVGRETGHYCTIWRRQADGRWKLVLDTGEPDPPPAKPKP
jgi:ketosteroid isomerase-like protein